MAERPLVEVDGVSVAFGDQTVLDNVSLSVADGQVVTIVGPNGAGKSTLIRVVLGLVKPTRGFVRAPHGLAIGYVPQTLSVERTLPLTVRRFLSLAIQERMSTERLRTALEEVRAAHVLDRQMYALSGGELRRVLLARAILRRPRLLALDEPVSGVDVAGQEEFYGIIARVRETTGCAVLMITHELHLVMAATDVVICLNRHVCCAGHPHAVSRDPAYASMFGGRLGAGLAYYAHRHDHVHDAAGGVEAVQGGGKSDVG